jgi:hypothetical protein
MPLIFMVAAILALVGVFRVEGSGARVFQVLFAVFLFALAACAAWGGQAVGWASSLSFHYPNDLLHVLLTRSLEFAVRIGIFLTTGIPGTVTATLGVVLSLSVTIGVRRSAAD